MRTLLKNRYIHLLLGLTAFGLMFLQPLLFNNDALNINDFRANLNNKELIAEENLANILKLQQDEVQFSFTKNYQKLSRSLGMSFYVVENGACKFWTNRKIPFSKELSEFKSNKGVVLLDNGWYQYVLKKQQNKSYLALTLIKHSSQIKNQYFKDHFHHSFNLSGHYHISLEQFEENIYVNDTDDNFLFSLYSVNDQLEISENNWTVVALFFIGFLLMISFASKQLRKISRLRNYSHLIVIGLIVFCRILILITGWFEQVYNMELFSPTIYAQSSFLPSLGQLLISTVFVSLIVYYFARTIRKVNPKNKLFVVVAAICCAILPLLLASLMEGLIRNSKINFDVNYLLDLSTYSFIGIGVITLLLLCLILIVKVLFNHFFDQAFKRNHIISIFWIFSLLAVLIGHFFMDLSIFLTGWILPVILIFSLKTTSKTSFYRSAFLIFIVASTTSYGFIHLSKLKEEVNKEFLAKKIAKERDPVAEFLFEEIEPRLKKDTLLANNIANYWENKTIVDEHIVGRYFSGYWTKYDVDIITVCQQNDSILIEPDNINVNCLDFFDEKIEREIESPLDLGKTLSFLHTEEGLSSYLAKIEVLKDKVKYYLLVQFLPKVFSKAEGYPELLLDEKNSSFKINTNQYSYAKYINSNLVDNVGRYNYSIKLNETFRFNEDGFFKPTYGNAYHVVYQSDKNSTIILSTPQKTVFNYITTFSYFFIISSFMALMIGIFFKISPFNWQLALSDFSTKIQLFIILSIFISFILFGWATTYYIKKQNHDKNKALLTEKVQSVLIELEHKLGERSELNEDLFDEMTYYLVKFSNVFYTDINLYDLKGELLASSRPEIFDRGLVGKQMDPHAFRAIHLLKKSHYTHNENIGELNYLSTYVAFRNNKNKILAYMNLPYFARQNELENELSSFYTALVNVYGLLFVLTAIIAIFFANYISEPVRLIKNKLSALQLGKSSELLEWKSNDEIGALVYEYNKKVLELEKSAQKLVQSERESAWREMAKQVAHEIKNPLTPMKLSIQQLERLAKDDAVDISERIERTAKTVVEQIDTLTKIADEFSSFAKMPSAHDEQVNLIPIIETTIDLYHEELSQLTLKDNCDGVANLLADKDQLSRVFNNLVKNAIQAIPEDREGEVEVEISKDNEAILILIADNGVGISEEKKDKIFEPNFTTKTTGMGLGLAMVKNIVENAGGTIWFETKANVGTTFYVKFVL